MRRRLAGRAIGLALATGLVACGGRTDHEALGDRAYGEARYADAIAEYLDGKVVEWMEKVSDEQYRKS